MTKQTTTAVMLLCLAIISPLGAQEGGRLTLNLEQALEISLANNQNLFIAEKKTETARTNHKRAFNVLYPSVSAGLTLTRQNRELTASGLVPVPASELAPGTDVYSQVMSFEKDISPYSLGLAVQGQLTLSPALLDGLRLTEIQWQSAQLSREEAKAALVRDIKKSYYNLLFIEENIKLTQGRMGTMKAQYEQSLTDYRNGRIPELTLLNTEVAYKNLRPRLSALRSLEEKMKINFALLMGLSPDTEFQLEGTIEIPEFRNDETESQPERTFAARSQDLILAQQQAAQSMEIHQSFSPALILSASWIPGVQDPFNKETWEDSFGEPWEDQGSISVSLSVPVSGFLPFSRDWTKQRELESGIAQTRAAREMTLNLKRAEWRNLSNALRNSLENLETLELSEKAALRNLELTRDGFQKGTQDFLALQNAEDEWNTARQNLLEEKLNYLTALFDLEYLTANQSVNTKGVETHE